MKNSIIPYLESCTLADVYTDPKTNKVIHTYHLAFRHPARTLTNAEVNKIVVVLQECGKQTPMVQEHLHVLSGGNPTFRLT